MNAAGQAVAEVVLEDDLLEEVVEGARQRKACEQGRERGRDAMNIDAARSFSRQRRSIGRRSMGLSAANRITAAATSGPSRMLAIVASVSATPAANPHLRPSAIRAAPTIPAR
jgi:hypothetical protein